MRGPGELDGRLPEEAGQGNRFTDRLCDDDRAIGLGWRRGIALQQTK